MGFGVDRAVIDAHTLSITLELFNLLVVINVFSVLEAKTSSSRQHQWQAGRPMAVSVGQATAVKSKCRIDQRSAAITDLGKSVEEVGELTHIEFVASGELLQSLLVAIVMRKRVAVTLDADLRHRGPRSFISSIEGYNTGHVGLEGQHDDVVHRPQVLTQPLQWNVAVEPLGDSGIDPGPRSFKPRLRPLCSFLHFANSPQVLIEPSTVFLTQLLGERLRIAQDEVKHDLLAVQPPTLLLDASCGLHEKLLKHDRRVLLGWKLDAIGTDSQPVSLVAQLK